MQKCIKLRIIKPYDDVTWEDFGTILKDTAYACFTSANYVMRECYLNAIAKLNKEATEKRYCYPRLVEKFPNVSCSTLNAIEQGAVSKWNQCSKDVLNSRVSLPTFKQGLPISLHNKAYKVCCADGDYFIDAQLCSNKCERTRYSFVIAANDRSTREILTRLLSGEYQKGEGQILKDRKNKWYFVIPYKFEAQYHDIDKNNIMGIDLGIVKAVYWAFNSSHKRGFIAGNEIEEFRRRVRIRRVAIQQQGKFCGDGRIGHGTARRLLPIENLKEKEQNFKETCNFRYAKRIVDEALRMRCGIIRMEDLTGINKLSFFLKKWPYFDLQTKIINKAGEFGIEVHKINPQYTSRRCSECGYIDKDSRLDLATFVCRACGYGSKYHCFSCGNDQESNGKCEKCGEATKLLSINADYNAARNIATSNIEEIILETLKLQELEIRFKKTAKDKRTSKV